MADDKDGATQPEPAPKITDAPAPVTSRPAVTAAQENASRLAAPSPDDAPPASALLRREEEPPEPAGPGKVNLAVPFPLEKVTVDGVDITREWTAVDEDTAARAHEAAALSGFKLRQA